MTDDWMGRAERAEHLLIALVSGDEAGLVCTESDWVCAYCTAQPDMSAAVVSMQHEATCPITQARALLQRLGLLR